jgi:hypothetical protein
MVLVQVAIVVSGSFNCFLAMVFSVKQTGEFVLLELGTGEENVAKKLSDEVKAVLRAPLFDDGSKTLRDALVALVSATDGQDADDIERQTGLCHAECVDIANIGFWLCESHDL